MRSSRPTRNFFVKPMGWEMKRDSGGYPRNDVNRSESLKVITRQRDAPNHRPSFDTGRLISSGAHCSGRTTRILGSRLHFLRKELPSWQHVIECKSLLQNRLSADRTVRTPYVTCEFARQGSNFRLIWQSISRLNWKGGSDTRFFDSTRGRCPGCKGFQPRMGGAFARCKQKEKVRC